MKIAQVDPGAPPENGLLATPVLSVNNNIVSWSPALDATWIDMTLKTAGDPAQTYNVQTLASDGYLDLSGAAPSGNYQLQAQYAGNVDGIPYGNSLQSQATGVSVNPTSMPGANYGGSSGATYVSAYQAPTFDPSSLIVSWIPMGGASMYFIQGNPQSSGGSSWESGVPTDYVTYQNGEYSWSIAGTPIQSGDYSIQVSGISSSGSVVAQTYGTAANIQEIDAPIGGTLREDADGNLTVSWNPVQGASVYNIQLVAQNPSDSNNPYEAGFWSTSTSYTFSADDVKELAQMTNGQGGNFTVSVIAQGPGYAASQSSAVGSVYFFPNY
ncbi:hypothetical protein SD51_04485 [Alicyclobacillus tengchongensis]|nr:hypothetical protein SD51_04485 [Alicyclobacillus tengchongensis]